MPWATSASTCIEAPTGQAAIDVVTGEAPLVAIIVDIGLPDMSGEKVIEAAISIGRTCRSSAARAAPASAAPAAGQDPCLSQALQCGRTLEVRGRPWSGTGLTDDGCGDFSNGRVWRVRGSTAAETSMLAGRGDAARAGADLRRGAGVIAYGETFSGRPRSASPRTLELLYINVRTAFESDYLVAANVAELIDDSLDRRRHPGQRADSSMTASAASRRFACPRSWTSGCWTRRAGRWSRPRPSRLPAHSVSYADRAYFAALRDGDGQAPSAS